MAAASPSPLASSVEKTNGAKLSRLLIDGGTTVLRNVFDRYHPPANLAADLNANYRTLNNLYKKKVLHQCQWDKLFPPGGATPDSKTFDITLLFLLLTNICGLSPPLSGWHKPPPSSDTSFEANLARVKLYRNELYGHVTSTGVVTAVFNVKWQEIGAVLVALGLNPTEVAKLKSAPCGEDYISAVMEWVKSDEGIKAQLREVHETQQEVRHTQLEDHEILQDNKLTLEEVRQMSTKTQEMLDEVHLTQTKTHETVEGVAKTQEERFRAFEADLHEIKQSVGSLKEERKRESQADEVLRNLAKSEFKGDIEYHVGRFQEGTREWVFNKVQNWLDDRNSQNRVMVISSNAGMGKSVICAVICKRMQEAGRLSGSHFCQHNNARYRNPQLMLQSLACHLCHALQQYKQALVEQLSRKLGKDLNNMGVEELFALLFKEPLSSVSDPGRNMLIVIDGLDESEYQERNELLDVIANHFCKLPCWIRFLCTTRPERNISEALKQLKPFQLEPNEEENVKDIKLFVLKNTQYLMRPENKGAIVDKLVEKSEGLMLYAHFVVSFIEENVSLLDQGDLDGSLPLAISSVYHSYFKRLENELMKELGVKEENFLNLLCAVTASREPLPVDFVSKVLVPGANSPIARRNVLKTIGSVSSLLPVRDDCLHVFHKSVQDWLTDASCYGEHYFTVDEKEGHRILANLCSDELDNLKQKRVQDTQFSPTGKYALQHGVRHMLQLDENRRSQRLEECVLKYTMDLELLYAKLFINYSVAREEILWLEGHEISEMLSEDIKDSLNVLTFLLSKYSNKFKNNPNLFFQTMLNEGGTVLSSVASNLLQNKYPDIPFMEFVQKQMQEEASAVLARFQCSSKVACFDVSLQLDYMVCECRDGTIKLWSLHTGELVWERPVLLEKLYYGGYRLLPSSSGALSFYRSVVFHPTANVVLPGVLSHAYTFDGDLKPLFSDSNCRFTVCSISGDKTTMLTDCPDDAKCIIMWSLKNGSEITRTTRNGNVLSFAWSRDGKLLAISFSTGSISIVDAMDGFRTLAETVIPEVCGMIKFSPDCRSLFCMRKVVSTHDHGIFRLNISMAEFPRCTLYKWTSYIPREFESHSQAGFLLGDPISAVHEGQGFNFVVNKNNLLKIRPSDGCVVLYNSQLRKTGREARSTRILDIVFSLSGETVYVFDVLTAPTVRAWNISSSEVIAQKRIQTNNFTLLAAVKGGLLLASGCDPLELWDFELSKCIRNWTNLNEITRMIPISEERVACQAGNKVTILDTTSGEIVLTFPTCYGYLVACNSKCQLLTCGSLALKFSDNKTTLWRKERFSTGPLDGWPIGIFSLSEQSIVCCWKSLMWVLDALSGKTLHILRKVHRVNGCKFVSDEECVISSEAASGGYCLQLFNVKSGDLLSVINLETEVNCLAAFPRKRLLAIEQSDSKHKFKLIQVHSSQDKDSRKSRW